MENKVSQAILGLNEDNNLDQVKDGQLTYALNAMVENFDGKTVTYQNEFANEYCLTNKQGFYVIGLHNIVEQNKTIFFITNPLTNQHEIGFKLNNGCEYSTIISSSCLNFNRDYPIHKIEVKTTNCSTQLYWTDGYNPMRYIDLDNLPWVETPNPDNDFQPIKDIGNVDCNKLLVQPQFSIPVITTNKVEVGGSLKSGAYQFAIQYSNSLGDGLTSFYGITNPVNIFESFITPDFNLFTTKAIDISISNIDTTGLYDYFNVVVLETENLITTPKLIGTFAITGSTYRTIYTGNTRTEINLTMKDIFDRYPYYDIAKDVTSSDNVLMWSNLSNNYEVNYQSIWSNVKLYWETHKLPYNKFEGYNNGINSALYKGYLRDEVYLFEGVFILKNGKITKKFPIPGRLPNGTDLEIITNSDSKLYEQNPCEEEVNFPRWKVYNTASVIDYTNEYKSNGNKSCYKGSYQYGEFGYYESIEKYPNNPIIYGDLAGKNIRAFKMPDCLISPIHDNNVDNDLAFVHSIYPLGVKIDMQSLYEAIDQSDLTQSQKDQIAGFKIIRADRSSNKSIVAKGILNNVGLYTYNNTNYFYPNYPFNDLNPDVFISSVKPADHSGSNRSNRLKGFENEYSKSRFTFHSPDTHFVQPFGIDSGYLKLETIEYGKSKGHFTQVEDNAKYKFLTSDAIRVAFAVGMSSIVGLQGGFAGLSSGVQAKVELGNAAPVFAATLELLRNITPLENYGWQFNNIGDYNNSYGIPNDGNKNRSIDIGTYVINGFQSTGDIFTLNNNTRESSVYLKIGDNLPFTHEYDSSVPSDNSRFSLTEGSNSVQNINDWFNDMDLQTRKETFTSAFGGTYPLTIVVYDRLLAQYPTYQSLIDVVEQSQDDNADPNDNDGLVVLVLLNAIETAYDNYVEEQNNLSNADQQDCNNPGRFKVRNISSYYGAIKKIVNDQYGRLNSYESIDTGFYSNLYDQYGNKIFDQPTIFGGDTYINRFALKIKHGFFLYNTALKPNETDINLDQLGNVGYPIYYYSTTPIDLKIDFSSLDSAINDITSTDFDVMFANVLSGGTRPMIQGLKIIATILTAYVQTLGRPNVNLECSKIKVLNETGKAYLYAYGIPYFFVESDINVDMRQAINDTFGDFYPHVSQDIPDNWLQEKNVPIIHDNSYTYNKSYSKQIKEYNFEYLREDYDPTKQCTFNFPNRVIYSQKANLEETKNNWLVYRPISRFDFPKNYGQLISIDGLEDRKLYVRYENKSQLYNVLTTITSSTGDVYAGNPNMFSQPPLDFAETVVGYAGSQHKLFIKTQFGHLTIDAQRGQISLFQGNKLQDISDIGLEKFYSNSLNFKIKEYFPNINTDNHFKDIGLTGVYDSYNKRFLITKKDYIPLNSNVIFDSGRFYLNNNEVSLKDSKYFCDQSFTVSFSLKTNSWVSFHSYLPDYYVPQIESFDSGYDSKLYTHNPLNTKFNRFYDKIERYIIEYPIVSLPNEDMISSISSYVNVLKYTDINSYVEVDNIFFNEAHIFNNQQSTGKLILIPKQYNRLSQSINYPKYNSDSKEIIVSKSNNLYNFNDFWDIISNKSKPFLVKSCNINSLDRVLDNTTLDYSIKNIIKPKIMGKEAKVRLSYNLSDEYKIVNRFMITEVQKSYK